MAITILDVAREAGVSKSTVSLVLHNSSEIPAATKQKVEQAIHRLGYVPNLNAQGLKTSKTSNIGIIILTADQLTDDFAMQKSSHYYQYDMLNGISPCLEHTEYGMLLEICGIRDASDDTLPRVIQNNRVDGAIILGSYANEAFDKKLAGKHIPIVVAGGGSGDFDCVITDHYRSAADALKRLMNTGHRRICFLDGPTGYGSSLEHRRAYQDVMRRDGEWAEQCWLVNTARNTGESALQALRGLWENGARPDAVIGANGMIMLGAVRFLTAMRMLLPRDVSLIALEDSLLTAYATPPISSMNISKQRMGEQACRLLLERLAHRVKSLQRVVVPVSYVDRGSVVDRRGSSR